MKIEIWIDDYVLNNEGLTEDISKTIGYRVWENDMMADTLDKDGYVIASYEIIEN